MVFRQKLQGRGGPAGGAGEKQISGSNCLLSTPLLPQELLLHRPGSWDTEEASSLSGNKWARRKADSPQHREGPVLLHAPPRVRSKTAVPGPGSYPAPADRGLALGTHPRAPVPVRPACLTLKEVVQQTEQKRLSLPFRSLWDIMSKFLQRVLHHMH